MNTFPTTQKIIKVGNSLAVTLPRSFAKQYRLQAGSPVFSKSIDDEIHYSVKKPQVTEYKEISDQEFIELLKDVESRYKNVLQKLANLP